MVKVHGIELQVGEKPPDLYKSQILAFNETFLRMFGTFERNPEGNAVFKFKRTWEEYKAAMQNRDLQYDLGYLLCSKVWKTLAYNQLVTVKKVRESYEEDGQLKKRTVTIVEPTSLGIYAYENGQIITVNQRWSEKEIHIGIGKLYTSYTALWERVERMAKVGGVAKTRIEKWRYEFKDYCFNDLLDRPREEAEELAIKFAREHIANAPTRFGRRNKIKETIETQPAVNVNHSLSEWQR